MTRKAAVLRPDYQDRLRFEAMLADLSSRFVNLPPDELDREIEDAERRVCECLGLDMAVLWLWSVEDPDDFRMTHLYRPLGGPPVPDTMDAREYFPWCLQELKAGRTINLSNVNEAPPAAVTDLEWWRHFGVRSVLAFPLAAGGGPPFGVLNFNAQREELSWPDGIIQRLGLIAQIFANALERKRSEEELQKSYAEVKRLKQQLELENAYLQTRHRLDHGHGRIVGESPAILKVLEMVEQVAPTGATVLIEGETGTGKELIAQRIHELSPRSHRPLVTVNCAALPSTLVESELFGREKGAFTGAVSREPGRFEVANGSTLLLDEVAELPLELQAKLLRVLEEGQYERVGSSRTQRTDVRVIAATNRDLRTEVEAGRFRSDLFFRLAVFPIRLPPLRDRRGDIPLLVWSAVEEFSAAMHTSVEKIRRDDMEALQCYSWPGNVRELRNVVERAMILSNGPTLRVEPPTVVAADGDGVVSLDDAQRRHIARALEAANGRIAGPGGAADLLGLKPTTLRSKMQRLGIDPRHGTDGGSSH